MYDIPDPDIEFEMRVMDKMKVEDFKKRLSERDMQILELRMEGYKQNEISYLILMGASEPLIPYIALWIIVVKAAFGEASADALTAIGHFAMHLSNFDLSEINMPSNTKKVQ